MEPRSPPVQVAMSTSTPSRTYRATVAAPLLASSSGCAWTASSLSLSSGTRPVSISSLDGMTEGTDSKVTWLTQEAYDRLNAELDHLSGPARIEITERIAAARAEGDLKENGGYHAAKDEQGKMEARIRQLNQILRNAKVGTPPSADSGAAGPGMVVTVKYVGDD